MADYERESGWATQAEVDFAKHWVDAINPMNEKAEKGPWLNEWLGTEIPFSFRWNRKESAQVLRELHLKKSNPTVKGLVETRGFVWTDDTSGLKVVWQVERFLDYPAVEWELVFENAGKKPISLDEVRVLNFRMNSGSDAPYVVHGANGGTPKADAMMPFSFALPSSGESQPVVLGGKAAPSGIHLPFFNIETPDHRGVIVGIGTDRKPWSATILRENSRLSTVVNTSSAISLSAGQKFRVARILLVLWQG